MTSFINLKFPVIWYWLHVGVKRMQVFPVLHSKEYVWLIIAWHFHSNQSNNKISTCPISTQIRCFRCRTNEHFDICNVYVWFLSYHLLSRTSGDFGNCWCYQLGKYFTDISINVNGMMGPVTDWRYFYIVLEFKCCSMLYRADLCCVYITVVAQHRVIPAHRVPQWTQKCSLGQTLGDIKRTT